MQNKIIIFLGCLLLLLFFHFNVSAQQLDAVSEAIEHPFQEFQPSLYSPDSMQEINGAVNCFDYYGFSSVQVNVEPVDIFVAPGELISFKGDIENQNDYPIVDGSVYVKIFKEQENDLNGHLLVDQFFALNNINLNANEQQKVNFDWRVPFSAESGEYQAAMFFVSSKKFNLLGLSFTDDVLGNTVQFSVSGKNEETVEFDKNRVTVNDKEYFFAAFTPKMGKDQEVTVKAIIKNNTKKTQNIPVEWKVYSWDGLLEENLIKTKQEDITVETGEKEIAFSVNANQDPVYFIVAEAKFQDTKSILNIRFARDDINKARINFPAVTNYPLKKGENNTVFMCLHNSGTASSIENNRVILTVLDENKKEISRYKYEGSISGDMMGLKEDFIPLENYSSFIVKAQIYTDNKLVDQAEMEYDCQKIAPETCNKSVQAQTQTTPPKDEGFLVADLFVIIIMIIALLIFFVTLFFLFKKKKPPIAVLLFLLILGGVGTASKTFSASKVVSKSYNIDLCYQSTASIWADLYYRGLSNPNVNVQYNANVYNADTGSLISKGASIPVGTNLRFEYSLGNISWHGTGNTWDTPKGTWMKKGAFPDGPTYVHHLSTHGAGLTFRGAQCSGKYYVGTVDYFWSSSGGVNVYIPFSVNPPEISLSRDASSQAKLSCSGNVCTVISSGTINTDFVFNSTYGNFYYEYNGFSGGYPGNHVSWNVLPMVKCQVKSVYYDLYDVYGETTLSWSKWSATIPSATISYNLNAISTCTPSCGNTNAYCDGVKYNDSCENKNACTGTYKCKPKGECRDYEYNCSESGEWTKTGDWYSKQCKNLKCPYDLLEETFSYCGESENCKIESCEDNAKERKKCNGNAVYTYKYGTEYTCEETKDGCKEEAKECPGTGTTTECEPGYVCKEDQANHDAECVPKATTWTEI